MGRLTIDFCATERFDEVEYTCKLGVRRAIEKALEFEGFSYAAHVSVTFCSNEYIRRLNRQFRGKDAATDVLSFPMYEVGEFEEAEILGIATLGDIVLSVERIREQARELGHGFMRECAFLTVHSVLHLLGYDHERSREDDEVQCDHQKRIIEAWEAEQ